MFVYFILLIELLCTCTIQYLTCICLLSIGTQVTEQTVDECTPGIYTSLSVDFTTPPDDDPVNCNSFASSLANSRPKVSHY
jgi:hypothetical protein